MISRAHRRKVVGHDGVPRAPPDGPEAPITYKAGWAHHQNVTMSKTQRSSTRFLQTPHVMGTATINEGGATGRDHNCGAVAYGKVRSPAPLGPSRASRYSVRGNSTFLFVLNRSLDSTLHIIRAELASGRTFTGILPPALFAFLLYWGEIVI